MKLSMKTEKKLVLNKKLIVCLGKNELGQLYGGGTYAIISGENGDIKTELGRGCVPGLVDNVK